MIIELIKGIINGEYPFITFAIFLDLLSNMCLMTLLRVEIKDVELHNTLIIACTRLSVATLSIVLLSMLQVVVVDTYFRIILILIGILTTILMKNVADLPIWENRE